MSTKRGRSTTDCFDTFPFPQSDPRTVFPELESIGKTLYEARAALMLETDQGLTKTYNALKDSSNTDPAILHLRELHETMDRAVLDAYDWHDVAVPPYCPANASERAALAAFEDEVIDRLYQLNAERAREEALLGAGGARATRATGARRQASGAQSSLFADGEDADGSG